MSSSRARLQPSPRACVAAVALVSAAACSESATGLLEAVDASIVADGGALVECTSPFVVSPMALDFGAVRVGTSAVLRVTVTNCSMLEMEVRLTSPSATPEVITSSGSGRFEISSYVGADGALVPMRADGARGRLRPGERAVIEVRYTPRDLAGDAGALVFTTCDNPICEVGVPVVGRGAVGPGARVDCSRVCGGPVEEGCETLAFANDVSCPLVPCTLRVAFSASGSEVVRVRDLRLTVRRTTIADETVDAELAGFSLVASSADPAPVWDDVLVLAPGAPPIERVLTYSPRQMDLLVGEPSAGRGLSFVTESADERATTNIAVTTQMSPLPRPVFETMPADTITFEAGQASLVLRSLGGGALLLGPLSLRGAGGERDAPSVDDFIIPGLADAMTPFMIGARCFGDPDAVIPITYPNNDGSSADLAELHIPSNPRSDAPRVVLLVAGP